MPLDDLWGLFEEKLFPVPSTPTLFNPYNGNDPSLDLPDAQEIRRENLRRYLESFCERPSVLLVGEAPGPRGCRFSGVPFTGEVQLCSSSFPFAGRQSSLAPAPYREMSGKVVWEVLRPHHPRFLLWNCVPLHPHEPGKPLSIRNPKASEVAAYCGLLREVHSVVAPRQVIAIGRHAERAFDRIGVPSTYVRHPSQGGAGEFRKAVGRIFGDSR